MRRSNSKLRQPQRRNIPILLSEITSESTCCTLSLPLDLACEICKPKICPLSFNRTPKKAEERLKGERNRCAQLWLSKWVSNQNFSTGQLLRHNELRSYLGIESDTILEFDYPKVDNKVTDVDISVCTAAEDSFSSFDLTCSGGKTKKMQIAAFTQELLTCNHQ